ncbi:MAG: ECF transporter S component [Clostridia bacterium]|nr:ECF transporter S component [Clostridia bacterium]
MKNVHIKNIVLSAMFLAIGIVLPFLTGQIQHIGNMLLPMHIPVLLCGLICGWKYGFLVGFIMPLLRSGLFSMPVMYPGAIAMAFELGTYALVVGILYEKYHWHCLKALYKSLVAAMVAGRIVWGMAMSLLLGMGAFTFKMFFAGAFVTAIPGIILQLILIPVIMVKLGKAKVIKWRNK